MPKDAKDILVSSNWVMILSTWIRKSIPNMESNSEKLLKYWSNMDPKHWLGPVNNPGDDKHFTEPTCTCYLY